MLVRTEYRGFELKISILRWVWLVDDVNTVSEKSLYDARKRNPFKVVVFLAFP